MTPFRTAGLAPTPDSEGPLSESVAYRLSISHRPRTGFRDRACASYALRSVCGCEIHATRYQGSPSTRPEITLAGNKSRNWNPNHLALTISVAESTSF